MKVTIETDSTDPKEIEKEVDEEIERFNKWFVSKLKNSSMVGVEKAILKTYLGFCANIYK